MSIKSWVNAVTFGLLVLVVVLGWQQITEAFGLLGRVNLLLLLLIIPLQVMSYLAVGQAIFSYIKKKGDLKEMSNWTMARMALELNFVNHIVPVSGVAGFSYLSWLLSRHNVSVGRSTMAQMLRLIMMFVSFVVLILLSTFILTFDNGANRTVIFICTVFIVATISGVAFLIYAIGSRKRVIYFAGKITSFVNKFVRKITRGKKRQAVKYEKIEKFFVELHEDYIEIKKDRSLLSSPLIWSFFSNILDIAMIFVVFMSLGVYVNPAALVISYGFSAFMAVFAVTPGGSGVYEAFMVAFLVSVGVSTEVAIAGTLLSRAIMLLLTILFGYIFYNLTLSKYGKVTQSDNL